MLKRIISSYFLSWLIAERFDLKTDYVDKKAFGNETKIYESAGLAIMFVTDRGSIDIRTASSIDAPVWFALWRIFKLLGYNERQFLDDEEIGLKNIAEVLQKECDRVKELLSPLNVSETERKIAKLFHSF